MTSSSKSTCAGVSKESPRRKANIPFPQTPSSIRSQAGRTSPFNITPKRICSSTSPKKSLISKTSYSKNNRFLATRKSPRLNESAIAKIATIKNAETMIPTEVDFQSILRIRPFTENERNSEENSQPTLAPTVKNDDDYDTVLFQKEGHSVEEYRFDKVLTPETTQKDTYEQVGGLAMAWDAITPLLLRSNDHNNNGTADSFDILRKNHVIISLGTSNSGKTHSIFGQNGHSCRKGNRTIHSKSMKKSPGRNRNIGTSLESDGDGIAPRIIDDLFFAEEDKNMRRMLMQTPPKGTKGDSIDNDERDFTFEVDISMVHVHNDRVLDMLSSYTSKETMVHIPENVKGQNVKKSTKGVISSVLQMAASFEEKSQKSQKSRNSNNAKIIMSSKESMETLRISQNPHTQDFCVHPTTVACPNSMHAKEVLTFGLKQRIVKSTFANECSSRGHTMITLIPILSKGNDKCDRITGGSITIMDLAGIERTKNSYISAKEMKESVAINKSVFGVLQCLRTIKKQSNARRGVTILNKDAKSERSPRRVEFPGNTIQKSTNLRIESRQNKLTQLIQPLFSGSIEKSSTNVSKAKTNVILFVSAYPGSIDYYEKKTLFSEIDALRGLTISHKSKQIFIEEETGNASNKNSGKGELKLSKESSESRRSPYKRLSDATAPISDKKRRVSKTETIVLMDKESHKVASMEGGIVPVLKDNTVTMDRTLREESIDSSKIRNNHSKNSPLKRISNVVTSLSGKKKRTKGKTEILIDKVSSLEDKIISLRENNEALVLENNNLKQLLENVVKSESGGRKQQNDGQLLQKSENHHRAQDGRRHEKNLLQSPLLRHMQLVENGGIRLEVNSNVGTEKVRQDKIFQRYDGSHEGNRELINLTLPHNNPSRDAETNPAYLELLTCITQEET